ncbi:MAG: hypothetical protein HQL84_10765, partial [Magnetococcales bacterium]|nr:hypothetical protein [Magnetococcales bacterium]
MAQASDAEKAKNELDSLTVLREVDSVDLSAREQDGIEAGDGNFPDLMEAANALVTGDDLTTAEAVSSGTVALAPVTTGEAFVVEGSREQVRPATVEAPVAGDGSAAERIVTERHGSDLQAEGALLPGVEKIPSTRPMVGEVTGEQTVSSLEVASVASEPSASTRPVTPTETPATPETTDATPESTAPTTGASTASPTAPPSAADPLVAVPSTPETMVSTAGEDPVTPTQTPATPETTDATPESTAPTTGASTASPTETPSAADPLVAVPSTPETMVSTTGEDPVTPTETPATPETTDATPESTAPTTGASTASPTETPSAADPLVAVPSTPETMVST